MKRLGWLVLLSPLTCAMGVGDVTSPAFSIAAVAPRTLTLSGPTTCEPNTTIQYAAVAKDDRGKTVPKPDLTWSSSTSAARLVTVSNTRRLATFQCVANGTTTITVSWLISATTYTATQTLTVGTTPPPNTPPIAAFTVACDTLGVCQFDGTGSTDAESAVTYLWAIGVSSPEPTTATTTQTYATAGSKTASLTVTDAGGLTNTIPHTFTVTITQPPVPVATVAVAPSTATIFTGNTQQFTATTRDASNNVLTGRVVTWGSSNNGFATVSSTGLATGVAAGAPTITATSEGHQGTATLTVTNPASCPAVTDLNTRSTTPMAKPGYLQTVTDPDFGMPIMRIAGDLGTPIGNGVSGTWPAVARHEYAKDQPWFADGRLVVLKHMQPSGGSQYHLFLDGDTYQPLFTRGSPPGGGDWRVHPTKPDTAIVVQQSGTAFYWNVRTNATQTRFTVSGYSGVRLGSDEGNVSGDGRYVPVHATRASDGKLVVFSIDLVAGTKSPDIDVLAQGFGSAGNLDWESVDQSGQYLVLQGVIDGGSQRSKIYTRATGAFLVYWSDMPVGHSDLAIDASGNSVLFARPSSGTWNNQIVKRRLSDNVVTTLLPNLGYLSYHASTRNLGKPGWGELSVDPGTVPYAGEILYVKMDGSQAVQRFAHHRSTASTFWAQAQGVPSPDGKRIMFASDWGVSGGQSQAYVIDARACP